MDSYGDDLTLIVQRMGSFHLKWIELNKTCKMLQSSLAEANSKNDELEMKLAQSKEETKKIKEDNKRLVVIVKKMERKLRTGSVHKLINVMKQTIRKYDEKVLPGVSELTRDFIDTNEELSISSSDDESDSLSFSLAMHNYSKALSYSTNDNRSKSTESCADLQSVQDTHSKVITALNNCSSETVSENTPVSESLSRQSTLNPAPSVNNDQSNDGNIQHEAIIDTRCDSRISSSSVILPSNNVEKPEETSVSIQTPNPDQCISSTSSSLQNNVSSTHDVLAQKSPIRLQSGFVVVCNIETLCVEEQNAEDNEPSSVLLNLLKGTSSNVNDKSSSNHDIENIEITDQGNSKKKPNDTVLPVMVVETDSKDGYDSSSDIVELQPSASETNQVQTLKRPCPSPSSVDESAPKRSTIYHSSPSANSSSLKPIKCLICEYENLDDSKTYATYIFLDDHIIEKHSCPFPPYKRCLFNTDQGQCRRHFHPKQNYHKHVKRAHSNQDLNPNLKKRLIRCADCTKLHLFESDFKEHRARFHDKTSNKNKPNSSSLATLRNVSVKKSKSKEKSEIFVRPAAPQMTRECEVCKKDNRPSAQYKLYDELDAHILKCHSDPFPEYFRCPYCNRHFRNVKWLTSHIIKKHPNKYSTSPLEKFLPPETSPEDLQQTMSNQAADEQRPTTPVPKEKGCALRILSPSTINSAISAVITSLIPPSQ